jgi:hypothetical protein
MRQDGVKWYTREELAQCRHVEKGCRCAERVWKHREKLCIRHDILMVLSKQPRKYSSKYSNKGV